MALMARTQPAGPRLWIMADAGLSLAPVLQDATGGDFPGSHALVTGTDAEPANCCGRGRAVPAAEDQYSSSGAYALISRPPFFFFSDSILHGQIWLVVPPRTFLLGPVTDRRMRRCAVKEARHCEQVAVCTGEIKP